MEINAQFDVYDDGNYDDDSASHAYRGLLAVDTGNTSLTDTRKAAGESGPAYYQRTISELLRCFAKDVDVIESYREEDFTRLDISARILPL